MKDTTVTSACRRCKGEESVSVNPYALRRYEMREGNVQDLFPKLSPSDREVLIGWRWGPGGFLCSTCWDVVFKEEEEPSFADQLVSTGKWSNPNGLSQIVPLCTSDDPNDHQGDTCPVHEGVEEEDDGE